ncbi:MAG: CAP domain-containing protein [Pseudomonadota bacterium]|nr:CAP domain-containing protein [Pseudomonadota bacterium]
MTMPFNVIDALLALTILAGLGRGWEQGFVLTTLQFFVLAAGAVLAFFGYRYPAALLEAQLPALGAWAAPLGFVAIYIAAKLVFFALMQRVVRAVPQLAHAHGSHRALGMLPGAFNGLIHAAITSVLLLMAPLFDGLSTLTHDSTLVSQLSAPAQWLEIQLTPLLDPATERPLRALNVPVQSQAFATLPFKVANPQVRPDLEARMLDMVNAERARQALQPLRRDPELAEVARSHSRDMFEHSYFAHSTPEGQQSPERLRQDSGGFLMAGENLALAPTLEQAHQGLMSSPGHRANVLRPQFGRVGIGVLDGGRYGLMITQNFRN